MLSNVFTVIGLVLLCAVVILGFDRFYDFVEKFSKKFVDSFKRKE